MKNLKLALFAVIILQGSLFSCAAKSIQTQQTDQSGITDSLAFIKYFNVKMPIIKTPVFKKDTFNIEKFGAVADGLTLNTKSINDAIKECSKKGGGVVL